MMVWEMIVSGKIDWGRNDCTGMIVQCLVMIVREMIVSGKIDWGMIVLEWLYSV